MPVLNYFKKNVINYLTRFLNKINEPKDLLISDSFVNWKILAMVIKLHAYAVSSGST